MNKNVNPTSLNLDKPIKRITIRPVREYIISCIFATGFMVFGFLPPYEYYNLVIIGVCLAIYGRVIYLVVKVKDRVVADLYADYILVYDSKNAKKTKRVDFKDIKDWEFQRSMGYGESLIFTFAKSEPVIIESLKIGPVVSYLKKNYAEKRIRPKLSKFFKKKKK